MTLNGDARDEAERELRPYAALCDQVESSGGHVRLVRELDGFALVVDVPTTPKRRRYRFAGLSFSTISDLDKVAEVLLAWVGVTERRRHEDALVAGLQSAMASPDREDG
jgi:hypothetical protein